MTHLHQPASTMKYQNTTLVSSPQRHESIGSLDVMSKGYPVSKKMLLLEEFTPFIQTTLSVTSLRLLLHTIPGPMSFQDVKTRNEQICDTYRQTCQLHDLLEDDNH